MFLFVVACIVITLLTAITIIVNILGYRGEANFVYAIICVFSYAVWLYRFIVGEPTVIMDMHDTLWQSQNFLVMVIATIIIAVLYLVAYVCAMPGLKVLLFFAFIVCTHPIVMFIIHIFSIGGAVSNEGSGVSSSTSSSNRETVESYEDDSYTSLGSDSSTIGTIYRKDIYGNWEGPNGTLYKQDVYGNWEGSDGTLYKEDIYGNLERIK